MEIILLQDIPRLGKKDDIINVKTGYAVNYLIPRGLAVQATKHNIKQIQEKKKIQEKKEEKLRKAAQELAEKIKNTKLKIVVKASDSGTIFFFFTNFQLADALKEKGIEVDKKQITIPEHIKELGNYKATIKLHKDIIAELEFDVVKE